MGRIVVLVIIGTVLLASYMEKPGISNSTSGSVAKQEAARSSASSAVTSKP